MATESITIRYGDIEQVAVELRNVKKIIGGIYDTLEAQIGTVGEKLPRTYNQMVFPTTCGQAAMRMYGTAEELGGIADTLDKVVALCEEKERAVKQALADLDSPEGYDTSSLSAPPSFADEYYTNLDATKKAEEEAKKKAEEEAAAAAAKEEAFLAFLATYFPETYAAYMQKLHDAEEAEWLEWLKETDPELYQLVMDEKKKQEEARKAAEEAAEALGGGEADGLPADSGGGGLGVPDSDSGLGGGGGGLGDLGSDFGGGGGGLGGFDSGWESDLLDDAIDTGEFADAGGALEDIAGADLTDAISQGADALAADGDLALEGGEAGFWGQYGDQIASFAHAYGLQAAALAGGAVALYATREQTTEAVAHVAEFVSTKCKPAALDVMDQVSGAAKQTRVNLSNAKSRVVGVVHGEKAGGLIG